LIRLYKVPIFALKNQTSFIKHFLFGNAQNKNVVMLLSKRRVETVCLFVCLLLVQHGTSVDRVRTES